MIILRGKMTRLLYSAGILGLTCLVLRYRIQDVGITLPLSTENATLALIFGSSWVFLITERVVAIGFSRCVGLLIALSLLCGYVVLRVRLAVGGTDAVLLALAAQIPLMVVPNDAARCKEGRPPHD